MLSFRLLCLLGVLIGTMTGQPEVTNVALGGIATHSGATWDWGHAINAIDGNRDSNWYHFSCSHTKLEPNPWWRVDLLKKYSVRSVVITNRADCCEERLNGARITIGNSPEIDGSNQICAEITAGQSWTFNCEGMEGRYVHVHIQGRSEYLTLCEVEVYAESNLKNVALGGIATQSGATWDWGHAINAIDGNRASNWNQRSCSHTVLVPNPWWRVDLLRKYSVQSVVITNRRDCCGERLNGARITIGNSPEIDGSSQICGNISIPTGQTWTFSCEGMEGRYVHVYIKGRSEYLALCEVEVYAESNLKNVALGGIATQSGATWDWGHAINAIDGNRDSNWYQRSCSHTVLVPNPWWRVDLLRKYSVQSVVITNRADCCKERLDGVRITIGNSPEIDGSNQICANIAIPAGQSWTFSCEGMEGRYVHVDIQGRSEYLTLCEVEVYAESSGRLATQFSGASTLSLCACALFSWIATALLTESLS